MANTIDTDGADNYFDRANHTRGHIWDRFEQDQKDAAVAQAKREVEQLIGRSLDDEPEDAPDYHFPDRATYEQALHLLLQRAILSNGDYNAARWLADESVQVSDERYGPECLRWLPDRPQRKRIIRG